MDRRHQRALEHLRELGARPAVPFHEGGPSKYIEGRLTDAGLPVSYDDFGNVIVRYSHGTPSGTPPLALVAHMDHPGFEVTESDGYTATAKALGGIPAAALHKPTRVLVITGDGRRIDAETGALDPGGARTVALRSEETEAIKPGMAVVFDLPDFELDGDVIRMRALDDLAGCAATLAVIESLAESKGSADVFGVFTRAEEGGLFGARLMAEAGTLPADSLVVSIESSPVIAGVSQGDGPVIRTGDALTTFDMEAEGVLQSAARSLAKRDSAFKHQRRLMSGGVCEGTAFSAAGYSVTGLAFPLGNYHNATTSIPDPDGDVGAEYITLSDFLGGVDLLAEAAVSVSGRDKTPAADRLGPVPDEIRSRLQS